MEQQAELVGRTGRWRARWVGLMLGVVGSLSCAVPVGVVTAQEAGPAFVDDAPTARDTLRGLGDLIARGGRAEAARALQRVLDEHGPRVVASDDDINLFVSVRTAVHARLLNDPRLLEAYGEVNEPRARDLLAAGRWDEVEESLLLTPSGFEAGLRAAQDHLESARFDAAWRVLRELDAHPTRRALGSADRELSDLGGLLLRYAEPTEADRAMLARWRERSGAAGGDAERFTPPVRDRVTGAGSARPGPAVDLTGMVPRPLTEVPLAAMADLADERRVHPASRVQATIPWAQPVVVGDRVYVNDGLVIAAWDRFTLRPVWRAPGVRGGLGELEGTRAGQRARAVDESTGLAVAGRLVVGATGLAYMDTREGDRRVHAVERDTGRVVWSVDLTASDPRLANATVRGPVVVHGDTVVVSLRKNVRSRRLVSSWLVGLDLADGSVRWVNLVSSAGSLPYQQRTRRAEPPLIDRGVVYRGDEVGVIAAVEVATGRPIWVRRLTDTDTLGGPGQRRPTLSSPLRLGDDIVLVSPDGGSLLRFAAATGEPRPGVDLPDGDGFEQLLRVGESLVVMSPGRAVALDLGDLAAAPRHTFRFDTSRMRVAGEPSIVGQEVMVPVNAGVLFVDPARGTERLLELDISGNAVALAGQVIVVSVEFLHSYLVWDAAADVLRARADAHPDDPAPSTTFAELAYRSARFGEILGAVDRALDASALVRDGEAREIARAELFEVVLRMVEASERGWSGAGPGSILDAAPQGGDPVIADTRLLSELIDRLARVAVTPGQRVSELLARGRFNEARSRPAEALEAYQAVLGDPELSATTWRGAGLSVRGELEATRRLERLIADAPSDLYAPFEAEAQLRMDSLPVDAVASEIERIARAYPVATSAVRAWRRVAESHVSSGREHEAIRAAQRGLVSARTLARTGRPAPGAEVGALAGWLVTTLTDAGRLEDASRTLSAFTREHPEVSLLAATPDGLTALDASALLADLDDRLATSRRLPRVGTSPIDTVTPRVLGGYLLRPVMSVDASGADLARSWADGVLVMSALTGRLSFVRPGGDDGGVEVAWASTWERDPVLLRRDAATAWLFTPDDEGARLHRVSLEDGAVIWSSPPWPDLIGALASRDPALAIGGAPGRISPPLGPPVRHEELLVVADRQTIAVVERTGRVVVLDAATGEVLWRSALGVTRVFDADLASGVLVVAGQGVGVGFGGSGRHLRDDGGGRRPVGRAARGDRGRPRRRALGAGRAGRDPFLWSSERRGGPRPRDGARALGVGRRGVRRDQRRVAQRVAPVRAHAGTVRRAWWTRARGGSSGSGSRGAGGSRACRLCGSTRAPRATGG
jgi:outer membrane protein assembly factor BamB